MTTKEICAKGMMLPSENHITLRLCVRNHPGVMSHVCGLFARRAFNVEGILCMPVADGSHSFIWLLVHKDQRLDQLTSQLMKLEDVLSVEDYGSNNEAFFTLEEFF